MSASSGGPGYETRDTSLRLVVWIGVGIFVVTVGAMLLMGGLFRVLTDREAAKQEEPASLMSQAGRTRPPEPRLEEDPIGSLRELRRREEELLTTYGWTDDHSDRVRIPIEHAMKLIAERGLPAPAGGADRSGGTP